MDGTHVCVKIKLELHGMYWNRRDNASLNIMAICSCHDTIVLQIAKQSDSEFPWLLSEKYYLVDFGYPNKK
ncbi:hypothetical protein AtNW77_Chr4g0276861 [Arabidopsis thaliana]